MSMKDPTGSASYPEALGQRAPSGGQAVGPLGRGPPPPAPKAREWKPVSIEDQVRHAYYVPTAHEYRPEQPARFQEPAGGKISSSNVPSALDAPLRSAAAVPGPGAYEVPPPAFLPEGGRMYGNPDAGGAALKGLVGSMKSDEQPGPDRYNPKDTLVRPANAGIKFEKGSKEAKYLKDAARLAAQVPGPGAYEDMAAAEYVKPFVPEGGRSLMASKPQTTYFEDAAALVQANPGPAAYSLPGAIDIRPAGQPVFKHESATAAESKRLVEKLSEGARSTPGPGTYNLPDPHPLMPAPSLKTKALSHGMPKPFDYNASPDYAGNFAPRPKELKLAPVREKNSGDQIFGRFSASGGAAPGGGASGVGAGAGYGGAQERQAGGYYAPNDPGSKVFGGPESSSGEDVFEEEPEGEAGINAPQEEIEDKVIWKEGGFEQGGRGAKTSMQSGFEQSGSGLGGDGLGRSRSLGDFGRNQPRHPAVEKAAKSYNRLSGFRKKPTRTFLPMAARRCEIVRTEDTSADFQRYYVCKSRLEEAGKKISAVGKTVLEPLDEQKLLWDAQSVLELKARMRLRVEGLSREKRMKVLAELPMLFQGSQMGGSMEGARMLGGGEEDSRDW